MRILVVDDEPDLRDALARVLRLDGHDVLLAGDGAEGLRVWERDVPDAVVLDVLMPEVDGIEVCNARRRAGDRTPILMLTARDNVTDRVAGLDAGADDYLVKPFALEELRARLRALLRRTSRNGDGALLRFADLMLDERSRQVHRGTRPIELTRTEFSLLELFLRHPRQVLTHAAIFEAIWGFDASASSNSLAVYMGYLRRKTEADGESRLLHTVRGVGYVLRDR
ncbi:MAG: two component transcriptional regulator, winged helix family [Solirubrobacterales bacterium]|nr:two component transcriptional regulator, winged helix family [Solirubrobacterales bacterium]